MRHPTRQRFARGSEGDDREEAGRDQPAEEGATHDGKLVGSVLGGAVGSYQACALTAPAASISTVSNVATSSQAPL
jgi:hypothetical protein